MANRHPRVLALVAGACGVLSAWSLHEALSHPVPTPEPEAAPAVRLHVRARPAAAPVPSKPVVREIPIETPKPVVKPKPKPQVVTQPAAPPLPEPKTVPVAPAVTAATTLDLPQQGLPASLPAATPDAPVMTTTPTAVPDAPPDSYKPDDQQYAEKPGGEVLVLGLLVDSTGQVLDTKIIVPSYNGLGDLSYAMVARRQKITQLDPPIAPGETRWLEVRVLFPKNQDILP